MGHRDIGNTTGEVPSNAYLFENFIREAISSSVASLVFTLVSGSTQIACVSYLILFWRHVTKAPDIFIDDIHLNLFWNIFFEWTLWFSCISRLRRNNNKSILFPTKDPFVFSKQKKSLFEYSGARTDSLAQLDRKTNFFVSGRRGQFVKRCHEQSFSRGELKNPCAKGFFLRHLQVQFAIFGSIGRCGSYTSREFPRFW